MPLVRVDLIEGRSPAAVTTLLDAIHHALVSALDIPLRDRYQIVQEHPRSHMVLEDTGLGIPRSEAVVVIALTSRPRSDAAKVKFYEEVCRALKSRCDIASDDVIVTITTNTDADWSFGKGRAQFITGEL